MAERDFFSSAFTPLRKFVFPVLWILPFGLGTLLLWLRADHTPQHVRWMFLFGWVLGSALIYTGGIRLKRVWVESEFLYVSNYLRTVAIPLNRIWSVRESRWLIPGVIKVTFRDPTPFGDRIYFKARWEFFRDNSAAVRLRKLAGLPSGA